MGTAHTRREHKSCPRAQLLASTVGYVIEELPSIEGRLGRNRLGTGFVPHVLDDVGPCHLRSAKGSCCRHRE